jgi:dTDP-4-dehydrorhamnose 3,5-epimerase
MIKVHRTDIDGLLIIQPRVFEDERGFFLESFNSSWQIKELEDYSFVQDNSSLSKKNVLRGLHFQKPPFSQGKLVRVACGAALDVAVDLRKNSPTYGRHFKVILNDENHLIFWIPPGFAHGFLSLADNTVFQYKCTNLYNKDSEDGLLWNDSDLNIDWGINNPIINAKDLEYVDFKSYLSPF